MGDAQTKSAQRAGTFWRPGAEQTCLDGDGNEAPVRGENAALPHSLMAPLSKAGSVPAKSRALVFGKALPPPNENASRARRRGESGFCDAEKKRSRAVQGETDTRAVGGLLRGVRPTPFSRLPRPPAKGTNRRQRPAERSFRKVRPHYAEHAFIQQPLPPKVSPRPNVCRRRRAG